MSERKFPIAVGEGLLPVDKRRISNEVVAGITLAALAIPEVMGYSTIAGMPVVTGLYTLLIPVFVFAILGSSRHLVVGADSATAAVMAAALAGMAPLASPQYVALAGLVALMAAVLLLIARLIKLGFIADFMSRTVLIGFLTGVGIQVAIGQIPGMLGIPKPEGGSLRVLVDTLKDIGDASLTTVAVALSVIVVIKGMHLVTRSIPGALVAVVGAIVISKAADLASHGVSTLGKVDGGLPPFGFPDGLTWAQVWDLVPTAVSLLILILAQSAATSRAYAARYNDKFDENTDLVGLSLANVGAGFTGTFVVNGSPTKTQMVDSAGGRTQLAQLTTGAITVIVLLFLTGPLQYLPNAVLAAVVFLIGVELVDYKGMAKVMRLRPDEFVVALLTAATVVCIGVEQGIVLAIAASVISHLRRSYRPHTGVLTIDSGQMKVGPMAPTARTASGLAVYHFSASLYYANANLFFEETTELVTGDHPQPLRWLCIEATSINDVDYSAAETLRQLRDEADEHGVRVVFAEVSDAVKAEFDRFGLTELFGADAFYDTASDVLAAYGSESGSNP